MNPTENKKKQNKPAERVSLTQLNVELLNFLLRQIKEVIPELNISKAEIVNWILKKHGDKFKEKEITELARDFFDPVKALENAILEAKKMQGLGEQVDVQALIGRKFSIKSLKMPARKPRRKLAEPQSLKNNVFSSIS